MYVCDDSKGDILLVHGDKKRIKRDRVGANSEKAKLKPFSFEVRQPVSASCVNLMKTTN